MEEYKYKEFIDPNRNDKFSKLRGLDLQDLIVEIENFYLIYRDTIGLESNVTFGLELEYEDVGRKQVNDYVKNFRYWSSGYDGSVQNGGEIRSPILCDEAKSWEELRKICYFLKSENANTCENAGGHVHIGAHILGKDHNAWRRFLKIYAMYENVLFRFMYGDKISARERINSYAFPIADKILWDLYEINEANSYNQIFEYFPDERYSAVNFCNVSASQDKVLKCLDKNTLEFRAPNATTEEVVWQNNVNTFAKLMLTSAQSNFDEDYIDYKIDNEIRGKRKYIYNEICLKSALEFVDLIFNNNLDKVYFLRQYFKNFESNYGVIGAVKAKSFIK